MNSYDVLIDSDSEELTTTEEYTPMTDDIEVIEETQESDMPPPKTPFRLYAKHLFLTYPQCSATKESVLKRVLERLDPEWAIVCQEEHADGTPHLHAVIKLKKRKNFRNARLFDSLAGKHGNYKSARNLVKAVSYVTKTPVYVAYRINVPKFLSDSIEHKKTTKGKADTIAERLREGETVNDINKDFPGYVMMNKRKLDEYAAWTSLKRQRESKLPWVCPSVDTVCTFPAEQEILFWIIENIKEEREFKQEQLWIWGPRGTGKTSLIHWLEKFLSVYWVPHEDFDDDWEDGCYDLAFIDEFLHTRRITWMNRFVQGGPMRIRKKGTQGMKQQNIPMIVCSNWSIHGAYGPHIPDVAKDTLACRFTEIEIPAGEIITFYNNM